jgi:hypothetical protein
MTANVNAVSRSNVVRKRFIIQTRAPFAGSLAGVRTRQARTSIHARLMKRNTTGVTDYEPVPSNHPGQFTGRPCLAAPALYAPRSRALPYRRDPARVAADDTRRGELRPADCEGGVSTEPRTKITKAQAAAYLRGKTLPYRGYASRLPNGQLVGHSPTGEFWLVGTPIEHIEGETYNPSEYIDNLSDPHL